MKNTLLILIALSFSMHLQAQLDPGVQRANHYIDHIVLGISDLDTGVEQVEKLTGVRPRFDGRDAKLGTQSAVILLGTDSFLEILAPDPKADPELIDAELKPLILDKLAGMESLTPFTWAVGSENLERSQWFARRAGSRTSEIEAGMRKRGWGRTVDWTWSRVTRPETRVMPLLVQWSSEGKKPQDYAPEGCSLKQLHLNSRTFKSVHALLATMQIDAEVEANDVESMSFTLECDQGEVNFEAVPLTQPVDKPR